MPCSVFEDDKISGLESRQFGSLLRIMFLRESDKINESLKNRRQEGTGRAPSQLNCDLPLRMSNNRTQTKFKNCPPLNANCFQSSLKKSKLKSRLFISIVCLSHIFRHFGQQ